MELLNPAFVILIVKITVCLLPGILGIYLLSISEDTKRGLRNSLCNRLFGVSNAIAFSTFERALIILSVVGLLLSAVASWFLLLARML